MSLTDEIDLEIGNHLKKYKDSISMDEVRNISIKVMRKRIDDLKQGYEKRYRGKSYVSIKKSTLDEVKELLK
jgi:hypothetical protein